MKAILRRRWLTTVVLAGALIGVSIAAAVHPSTAAPIPAVQRVARLMNAPAPTTEWIAPAHPPAHSELRITNSGLPSLLMPISDDLGRQSIRNSQFAIRNSQLPQEPSRAPSTAGSGLDQRKAALLAALDFEGLSNSLGSVMLRDPFRVSRALAARALASEANPSRTRLVGEYAGDSDPWARHQAMLAAGRMGEPGLLIALGGLGDASPLVRQAAVWAVAHGGDKGFDRVVRLLASEPEQSVLEVALSNLWRFTGQGWEAHAARFASHRNPGLRRAAAASLARSNQLARADGLRRLARDTEPVIRVTAIAGLGIGDLAAPDYGILFNAVTDDDWRVRAAACTVLAALDSLKIPDDTASLVAELWTARRGQLAVPALRAAGAHPEIGEDEVLKQIALTGEPWPAGEALVALSARSPEPAVELAMGWLADGDLWQRRAAARSLAALKTPAPGDLIDTVIADPDATVRLAWLDALDQSAVDSRLRTLWEMVAADPDPMVRSRCLDLLGDARELSDRAKALGLYRVWAGDQVGDARAAALIAALKASDGDDEFRAVMETAEADSSLLVRAMVVNEARELGLEATAATGEPRHARKWYRDLVAWAAEPRWMDVVTVRGTFRIRLELEEAPITSREVWGLAEEGFYDGLDFHRVVSNFVVQGGDPRGDGWGGPGFVIPDEPSMRPFDSWRVGIATSGPQTGGSQFFFMLLPSDRLTGHYTNFGEVVEGREVLTRLQVGDRIVRVETATGEAPPAPTPVLLDRLSWEDVAGLEGWEFERETYEPDPQWVDQLISAAGQYRVIVVLGTWCSDSGREVPRLQRVVEEVGGTDFELVLVGVDRTRRVFVDGLSETLGVGTVVERVPTIVVVDETGAELGRIVETAELPLEQLLAEFVSSPPGFAPR